MLRVQSTECELVRNQATDPDKRDLFNRLAEHHRVLAFELERAIASAQTVAAVRVADPFTRSQGVAASASVRNIGGAFVHTEPPSLQIGGWLQTGRMRQSSRWQATSACRAFLISASFSGPGGSFAACSSTSIDHATRRSYRVSCWLKRRRCFVMARSFPWEEGGSAN
jgi:hypothetical protein